MNDLRYIGTCSELIAVITGCIYYYKYKNTYLKYFLALLFYVFINEIFGKYLREHITNYNAIIYNIYYIINFTYLFLLYQHYITDKVYKICIKYFLVAYLISVVINGFYENYLIQFQRIPYIIAASFLIITILFYFIETINSDTILQVNKSLLFWISIGLLIYYSGVLPTRIVRNYYQHQANAKVLFLINLITGSIMYICFSIGFIRSKKNR